jgi:hypothetical protein
MVSNLKGLGTAMVSGTKGMIVDTLKDILANMLAQVVKHDIYSFADWGKNRVQSLGRTRKFVGGTTTRELPGVNSQLGVGVELTAVGPS